MQSLAHWKAAAGARARRRGDGQPGVAAVELAGGVPHRGPGRFRARTSMSAQRCFTAWNWPMGRPNCMRVRACSAAVSTHHCATPSAFGRGEDTGQGVDLRRDRTAAGTAAPRRRRRDDLGHPSGGVEARSLPDLEGRAVEHAPGAGAVDVDRHQHDVGHRRAPRLGGAARDDQVVASARRSSCCRARGRPPRRMRASVTRSSSSPHRSTAVATTAVGSNGPGRQTGTGLLEHDRELGHAVALAAVLLRRPPGRPSPGRPARPTTAAGRRPRVSRTAARRGEGVPGARATRAAVAASSRCSSLIASPVTVARPSGAGGGTASAALAWVTLPLLVDA